MVLGVPEPVWGVEHVGVVEAGEGVVIFGGQAKGAISCGDIGGGVAVYNGAGTAIGNKAGGVATVIRGLHVSLEIAVDDDAVVVVAAQAGGVIVSGDGSESVTVLDGAEIVYDQAAGVIGGGGDVDVFEA